MKKRVWAAGVLAALVVYQGAVAAGDWASGSGRVLSDHERQELAKQIYERISSTSKWTSSRNITADPDAMAEIARYRGLSAVQLLTMPARERRAVVESVLQEVSAQNLKQSSTGVLPGGAQRDWRDDMLDEAVSKGRSDFKVSGGFFDGFNQVFRVQGPVSVKARVVKSLPTKGCKRIEVSYQRPDVWVPTIFKTGADLSIKHQIDYCRTGTVKAPESAIVGRQAQPQASTAQGYTQSRTIVSTYDVARDAAEMSKIAREMGMKPLDLMMMPPREQQKLLLDYLANCRPGRPGCP